MEECDMKLRLGTLVLVAVFASSPVVLAQNKNAKAKPTVGGEMKESGKEVGKAGTSLGHNIKHGRPVRGGKHFGKHMGRAGKHFGKGSGVAAKKTGNAVKNAAKP
jgi:hypothetical protein